MSKVKSIGPLIGGESLVGGGRQTRPVLNPATGEAIAELTLASQDDVRDAADRAAKGFLEWSVKTPLVRSNVLRGVALAMRRDAAEMAQMLTREQGKTLKEAQGEVLGSADLFDWLAEEGKRLYGRVVPSRSPDVQQLVLLEPVGPVAAFSPWNYPLALAARKVAHALAAGCSVVIKPAEEAPSAVLHLARLCLESGVPADAIHVLFGVPAMVSETLVESAHIQKISFTGSVSVGRHLASLAGRALKKVTFELGGHSPVIVMEDADLDLAVALSVASKFRNAGQICIAPTRFFVHDAIYDAFVGKFSEIASALRVEDGMLDTAQMGPLAHERRLHAMEELAQDAVGRGARLVTGMAERTRAPGFFWKPTVLTDVPKDARILQEEPFGPIAPFVRIASLDQALQQANDVQFGLAGYAFTRSLRNARRIQDGLKVGALGMNTFNVTAPEMPFLGVKDSGLGVAQGKEGLLDHMNIKAVYRAD
ncbi:NAD-dependent succinate-semialdehyde dehydrogenase [Variovorax sp. efr-133-TYG-130]|uniref:NAD-dependent succinate-semialdehyde dehydrogenase n=1 Tax=Variovorax sp. efr-133-TYG-130 TaxID=3040327 RepID=UPI002552C0F9|nr:NAD-dependent succinate-semialdehyde dehydrogenase [Variovorax sp. efr-133-TYG-130]